MDLAHECHTIMFSLYEVTDVSILVLVDLAHELVEAIQRYCILLSFNPCFSGSCSRINIYRNRNAWSHNVSILVLVDLAHELWQGWSRRPRCLSMRFRVSILVLMDLAHEYFLEGLSFGGGDCFNPCFNGSCSRIGFVICRVIDLSSFNPCFNGSCSRMIIQLTIIIHSSKFQSLF